MTDYQSFLNLFKRTGVTYHAEEAEGALWISVDLVGFKFNKKGVYLGNTEEAFAGDFTPRQGG